MFDANSKIRDRFDLMSRRGLFVGGGGGGSGKGKGSRPQTNEQILAWAASFAQIQWCGAYFMVV